MSRTKALAGCISNVPSGQHCFGYAIGQSKQLYVVEHYLVVEECGTRADNSLFWIFQHRVI